MYRRVNNDEEGEEGKVCNSLSHADVVEIAVYCKVRERERE